MDRLEDGYALTGDDGRLRCGVCPRACALAEGATGWCGVRRREGDRIALLVDGLTSGVAVDPVEKKPLHHWLPGSRTLSFGTVGCNLGCDFCQNHRISRARPEQSAFVPATPDSLADAAAGHGCASIAVTYNEPVVWLEFAIRCAAAAHARGLLAAAVTAGQIHGAARRDLFSAVDAANVDLKAFSDGFYRRRCAASLAPVLDTLRFIRHETACWLELTTLVIPGENDGDDELRALAAWVARELGRETPLHLSAFHPAHRLRDRPPTPLATVQRARTLARAEGLRHVYTGNVADPDGAVTACAACGGALIRRDGYRITANRLVAGRCPDCGARLAGRFAPGGPDAAHP
jgi:pyruvate formate lyase activating enzyme